MDGFEDLPKFLNSDESPVEHRRATEKKFYRNRMGKSLSDVSGSIRNDYKENSVMSQVHRPLTGGMAAKVVNKKKSLPEVIFKPNQSTKSIEIFEDEEEDQTIPMIETDDFFEEPVVDIDVSDTKNPLAVVEYVDDIYANYRKMESYGMVSPNYMLTQQSDINEKMRAMLIDWLIEVHYLCHFQDETLFLTVNIIDRFLAKQSVSRKKLQLVGMVAMLLACKYVGISVPVVGDLIYISAKAYSRSEILEMENLMLHTLEFKISFPTPYVFLKRYLKAGQSDSKLDQLSSFLMDLCLVEYETVKFTPSLLAAACVYTAQCSLSGFKHWSKTCEWHTKYSKDELLQAF
ncbi:putative cyclin [Helianthus annuus]|uniref:Cyclin n=1 Tax=Helianthus annuus TaxID=4232 RepID=A0A9K3H2Q0_HELAN|nr:putative cyclin [Helianthus annuus]KAJ0473669.1 putative cyclin domain-containing protein [Helianthus annuus]KAJ0649246.1 putative cyclin domain-containing protein [Helianthus annuus]KAJ0653043.1 putative cyclin domain-containing protein [Helianthus annuus]KAJ0831931.1 putative cyclin [Helianthus annuus]